MGKIESDPKIIILLLAAQLVLIGVGAWWVNHEINQQVCPVRRVGY